MLGHEPADDVAARGSEPSNGQDLWMKIFRGASGVPLGSFDELACLEHFGSLQVGKLDGETS